MAERESDQTYAHRTLLQFNATIAREAPEGIGAYHDAWNAVAKLDRAFLEALTALTRGTGSRRKVRESGAALMAEWRRQFEAFRKDRVQAASIR